MVVADHSSSPRAAEPGIAMQQRHLWALVVRAPIMRAFIVAAAVAATSAATAQTVTVGAASTLSDAPIYIADQKGFFRAEGLNVKVVNFRSAADMVAPLGTGELDAGAGSAGASLYNAV